jgi:hypothetical protein
MRVPAHQASLSSFDEKNAFLRAILGLRSRLERFDELLELGTSSSAEGDDAVCDEMTLALLGAIAMKSKLVAVLWEAARESSNQERPVVSDSGGNDRSPGGLLR